MKRFTKPLIAVLLLAYACGVLVYLAMPRIAAWTDRLKVQQTGFVTRVFFSDQAEAINFLVFKPHVKPPTHCNGYPVLLFLNGIGENGSDGLLQISNTLGRSLWEVQSTFPFIVVAPQCRKRGSWDAESGDAANAMAILEQVLSEYPCDRNRIYLTGVSAGGAGVFRLAKQHPRKFAALVPVAATATGQPDEIANDLIANQTPLWNFFNGRDIPSVVNLNRSLTSAMLKAGCDYKSTEYNRSGHNSWDYAYRDPCMYRWLLDHSLETNRSSEAFKAVESTFDTESTKANSKPSEAEIVWFDFQVAKHANVVFETTFLNPQELILERTSVKSDQPLVLILSLGCQAELREFVAQRVPGSASSEHPSDRSSFRGQISLANSNLLIGQAAIRKGDWNHVSVRSDSGVLNIDCNGWPLWRFDAKEKDMTIARLGIVRHPANESSIRQIRFTGSMEKIETYPPTLNEGEQIAVVDAEVLLEAVRSALHQRAEQSDKCTISWRESIPLLPPLASVDDKPSTEPNISKLRADRHQIAYASFRRDTDPYHASNQSIVLKDHKPIQFNVSMLGIEPNPSDFATALATRFKEKSNFTLQTSRFIRSIVDDMECDHWKSADATFTKCYRRNAMLSSPIGWARLTAEIEPQHQINSLQLQAALMSMGRIFDPPLAATMDQLEIVPGMDWIDGRRCVIARQTHDNDARCQRLFSIDLEAGGLIRRYQGKVPPPDPSLEFDYGQSLPIMLGEVMIEIDYDETSRQPKGWSVVNCQSQQSPLQFVSSGEVIDIKAASRGDSLSNVDTISWLKQPNTWFVDERTGEQYITLASGDTRVIASDEQALQPSFKELVSTSSGQLEAARLSSSRMLRIWLAIIGIVLLTGGIYKRRQARFSGTAKC